MTFCHFHRLRVSVQSTCCEPHIGRDACILFSLLSVSDLNESKYSRTTDRPTDRPLYLVPLIETNLNSSSSSSRHCHVLFTKRKPFSDSLYSLACSPARSPQPLLYQTIVADIFETAQHGIALPIAHCRVRAYMVCASTAYVYAAVDGGYMR